MKQLLSKTSNVKMSSVQPLTHLPLVPHIYASVNWVRIGSDNGLSPVRRQAITWTNADLLSFGPWGTNFSGIRIEIHFSFMKTHLKMSSFKMAAILSRSQWVNVMRSVQNIGICCQCLWQCIKCQGHRQPQYRFHCYCSTAVHKIAFLMLTWLTVLISVLFPCIWSASCFRASAASLHRSAVSWLPNPTATRMCTWNIHPSIDRTRTVKPLV